MIRKYAEIFCWKNVSSFCSAKATHIFSAKNIRILYIESVKTVNEMTLNELVKLTTLWTTGPWSPVGWTYDWATKANPLTFTSFWANLAINWWYFSYFPRKQGLIMVSFYTIPQIYHDYVIIANTPNSTMSRHLWVFKLLSLYFNPFLYKNVVGNH